MKKNLIVALAAAILLPSWNTNPLSIKPNSKFYFKNTVIESEILRPSYPEKMKSLEEKAYAYFTCINSNFKYKGEIPQIIENAKIFGIEPELLMAIRMSENGKKSQEYGVLPGWKTKKQYKDEKGYLGLDGFYFYKNEKEKQLHWAAKIVKRCLDQFNQDREGQGDFISYLASIYAPKGAKNDPKKLNNHWESNVKQFYRRFKKISK